MIDVAILVIILGSGAVALKLLGSKSGEREADAVWTTAARRVGGEVEITTSRFLRPSERGILLTACGVQLIVRTDRRAHGSSREYYTHVSAGPLPGARAARIHCAKRDLLLKLKQRLGFAELPTGDQAFDQAVQVTGAPASLVRAFLDGPTRRLVAASDGGFDLEDARVFVQREGIPTEVESLVAMTRFAERLVERWCALMRGPARLAAGLGFEVDEARIGDSSGAIASGVHRSRSVTLSLRVETDIILTVLSFEDPSSGEWTMERGEDDAFTASGAPPEPVRTFLGVAPASLLGVRAIAGSIELAFDGLAPAHDEVRAALDALIDATSALTPYR